MTEMTEIKTDEVSRVMNKREAMVVLYDKECPICNHFACAIDTNNSDITVRNSRHNPEELVAAAANGLDIDQGAIVFYQGRFCFGDEAICLIANHSDAKGFVGWLNRNILRHRQLAKVVYPLFVRLRRLLLWLKGKPLIGESSGEKP